MRKLKVIKSVGDRWKDIRGEGYSDIAINSVVEAFFYILPDYKVEVSDIEVPDPDPNVDT